ncbi:MAG TPA: Ig-like domain-containing protein, partial [Thermoanaerobaculia bacterium]|nr:Ig-like domain-containing protein [Thermoanaerobaculia bacterium]
MRRKALRPVPYRAALAACLLLPFVLAPAAFAQDVDPPVIAVTESGSPLADDSLWNRAVTPVVDVTDASPPVVVDLAMDGAPFTSGSTVSGEGAHQLVVTATDDASNVATLTIDFEIDTVAPVFVSVSPEDGALTAAAEVTITGEVAGADAVTVDGVAASLAGGSFSAGPFALSEGERTFSVVASDAAGNSATRAHRAVRDSTPPTVSLSQPAAGAVVGASPVDVVGSVADPHLSTVTVNGTVAAVTGGTFVARNVPLAEGSTPLVATATDAAGNSAQASRSVTLDTQPPALAVTDPAAGTVTPVATLTVTGTANDPHLDRVEVAGVTATLTAGTGGAWTWSAAVPLTEGSNALTATAWDVLGHQATANVSVERDSTAPAISIVTPGDGAWLSTETVDVAGTVVEEPDLAVTVNGAAAALTAGDWDAADVPLAEGENRLIARVTDGLGNQGAHTRVVYRDTVAPELVAADPVDGALAVPPGAAFALTFSESMAEPSAGDWRLELADGSPVAATATLAGEVLTVRPDADLASEADLRLV